jgi:predicted nucleotide-binding protein
MRDLALTIDRLNGFMNLARENPQSDILKWFLRRIVLGQNRGGADLCQSGSVMVCRPADDKLHVFNDDEFLFTEGLLDKNKFKKMVFNRDEGMAGEAFSSKHVVYDPDVKIGGTFVDEGEPIKSMLCAPIKLPSRRGEGARPFGVVSFHNGPDAPEFSAETQNAMKLSVNCLGFALDMAARMPWNSVFIVHGRNTLARTQLELILRERGVSPKVLAKQPAGGAQLILPQLEQLLADCCAGFVLMTPDDEGRLTFGVTPPPPDHKPRARQNVVFEGGWLVGLFRQHERICFLLTDPGLEKPSDLDGLRWLYFNPENPDVAAIEEVLRAWGINFQQPARR